METWRFFAKYSSQTTCLLWHEPLCFVAFGSRMFVPHLAPPKIKLSISFITASVTPSHLSRPIIIGAFFEACYLYWHNRREHRRRLQEAEADLARIRDQLTELSEGLTHIQHQSIADCAGTSSAHASRADDPAPSTRDSVKKAPYLYARVSNWAVAQGRPEGQSAITKLSVPRYAMHSSRCKILVCIPLWTKVEDDVAGCKPDACVGCSVSLWAYCAIQATGQATLTVRKRGDNGRLANPARGRLWTVTGEAIISNLPDSEITAKQIRAALQNAGLRFRCQPK